MISKEEMLDNAFGRFKMKMDQQYELRKHAIMHKSPFTEEVDAFASWASYVHGYLEEFLIAYSKKRLGTSWKPAKERFCEVHGMKGHTANSLRCDRMKEFVAEQLDESDARLIAAAPDLLEAAKMARRVLGELRGGPHEEPAILRALCEAIAKAEAR